MKSRASSGIFWWDVFIRKFQFVNTFQRSMLVLIKPSLGKSFNMQYTIFGQNQKQTYLNPCYQDASGQRKHPLFIRTRFKLFLCSRQCNCLSSNFSHPSGRHTGQSLYTIPYFLPSVEEDYFQHLLFLVRKNHTLILFQKIGSFLGIWYVF